MINHEAGKVLSWSQHLQNFVHFLSQSVSLPQWLDLDHCKFWPCFFLQASQTQWWVWFESVVTLVHLIGYHREILLGYWIREVRMNRYWFSFHSPMWIRWYHWSNHRNLECSGHFSRFDWSFGAYLKCALQHIHNYWLRDLWRYAPSSLRGRKVQ